MKEFKYVIKDEQGIHARPAGMLVKEVNDFIFISSLNIKHLIFYLLQAAPLPVIPIIHQFPFLQMSP